MKVLLYDQNASIQFEQNTHLRVTVNHTGHPLCIQ